MSCRSTEFIKHISDKVCLILHLKPITVFRSGQLRMNELFPHVWQTSAVQWRCRKRALLQPLGRRWKPQTSFQMYYIRREDLIGISFTKLENLFPVLFHCEGGRPWKSECPRSAYPDKNRTSASDPASSRRPKLFFVHLIFLYYPSFIYHISSFLWIGPLPVATTKLSTTHTFAHNSSSSIILCSYCLDWKEGT